MFERLLLLNAWSDRAWFILCAVPSLTSSEQLVIENHTVTVRARMIAAFNVASRAPRTSTSYLESRVHVALRLAARDDHSQLRRDRLVAHKMYGVSHKINSANNFSLLAYQELSPSLSFPALVARRPGPARSSKRKPLVRPPVLTSIAPGQGGWITDGTAD
jgi:hypothetical protein